MSTSDQVSAPDQSLRKISCQKNKASKKSALPGGGEGGDGASTGRRPRETKQRNATHDELICKSCGFNEGLPMLRCKYFNCTNKFYHLRCVKVEAERQDGTHWACDDCKIEHGILPAREQEAAWGTKADVLAMFPGPAAPRGPGGDVYGLDSWSQAAPTLEYVSIPEAESNSIRRIKEQESREGDSESKSLWRVDIGEIDYEEWDEEVE